MTGGPHVVGLGESLLRLSVPDHSRFDAMTSLAVDIGGAEMNSLIAVARLGGTATWLTRLADNPLGRRISAHAAGHYVHPVVDWDASARAPLYFVEHGVAPRPSEVLYDRRHTAMQDLRPDHFDWAEQVRDADIAYCTGITCALGDQATDAVEAFFAAARAAGCEVAFDLNFRSRLWSWGDAVDCLRRLLPLVDVLFASANDLRRLYNTDADPLLLARKTIGEGGPPQVVLRTSRPVLGGGVTVTVAAVTADDEAVSAAHDARVVDPFGAGDAASGAFLTASWQATDLTDAVDLAAWACSHQHTIPGDAWLVRAEDLQHRSPNTEHRSINR